jgi:hypothetical protein
MSGKAANEGPSDPGFRTVSPLHKNKETPGEARLLQNLTDAPDFPEHRLVL